MVRDRDREYTLRGSETRTLATVGAFRVVSSRDLRDHHDRPLDPRSGDLRHLREQGLINTVRVPGSREHAVALTKEGRGLLERHRERDQGNRQTFWDGLKREREREHDLQVYRAYERAVERLANRGARVERVILDHELKREYQTWLHERDRDRSDYDGHPDRTDEEIRGWAIEHDLPYFDDEAHFPDLRIEYQEPDRRWEHDDIQGTTEHYRGAHAASAARERLYHIHHRPLYHATGEPGSRYRRTVPVRSAAERLMRLDAALTDPNLDWLTTRCEKVAYIQARTAPGSLKRRVDPQIQETPDVTNEFPGTFPIGIDTSGHVTLLYLATVPWTDDFRTFLFGHTTLLGVTPAWTMRLVFPQPLRRALAAYQTVIHEELESPLQADTIYDLKRYFFHRRRGTDLNAIPEALRAFLKRCAEAFGGPRFTHLYRRWLTDEDAAWTPVSPVASEALASGHAQVECVVLPHTYEHLSPLVSRRRARRRGLQKRDERGDVTPHSINPSLNPLP